MNTIICLNDEKRKALQSKLKHKDGLVVLHAVILLLLDLLDPKAVATLLGLSLSNLYKRKDRFLCEGLDSLGHQPRSGRPSELKGHQERIIACLEHSPRRYGFCTGIWTTHCSNPAHSDRLDGFCRICAQAATCYEIPLETATSRPCQNG